MGSPIGLNSYNASVLLSNGVSIEQYFYFKNLLFSLARLEHISRSTFKNYCNNQFELSLLTGQTAFNFRI